MAVSTCQLNFSRLFRSRRLQPNGFLKRNKFGIEADFTNNINVESVDEVNPLNRFEIL